MNIKNITKEEENKAKLFLERLVGIESYIKTVKSREPLYCYDNFEECNGLKRIAETEINKNSVWYPQIMALISFFEAENEKAKNLRATAEKNSVNKQFYDRLKGIASWVNGQKNGEPGFLYDNENEYKTLLEGLQTLDQSDTTFYPACEQILNELEKDIIIVKERKSKPIRTPEEEDFYRHIVGINSWLREQKALNPGFLYDNVAEMEQLNKRFADLKTTDNDIVLIMGFLNHDIDQTKKNFINVSDPQNDDSNKFEMSELFAFVSKLRELVGCVKKQKEIDPSYRFDNEQLFAELKLMAKNLKTADPEVLDILILLSEDLYGESIEQPHEGFKNN